VALIPSGALRQRLEALRQKYAQDRRIAHVQAIVAAMVQLDEVEAYAEEQEAALLHDRAQLATIGEKS
jgi:AmiR/NasT family two-component response regulator